MSHPVARTGDQYVALDKTTGSDADIQTTSFPAGTALTPAPAPIATTQPERMAAWAPGGVQLGFVRTTAAGRRTLPIFDLTPGLQTILDPAIDLGPDAPSPQTRAFQSSWGGLSLAESRALDVRTVTCTINCLPSLQTTITKVPLKPTVSLTTSLQTIGIFVVRVTGTRKLLGRTVPRIRPIGRVPLGATSQGPQLVPLEREGQRPAAQARDLPADVSRAPRQAHREHLRLHPLQGEPAGPDPGEERLR